MLQYFGALHLLDLFFNIPTTIKVLCTFIYKIKIAKSVFANVCFNISVRYTFLICFSIFLQQLQCSAPLL